MVVVSPVRRFPLAEPETALPGLPPPPHHHHHHHERPLLLPPAHAMFGITEGDSDVRSSLRVTPDLAGGPPGAACKKRRCQW